MQADRETFGPRLKFERERRGITLKDIAESTKIKESQFAELERGDLSKWPQGIFRRAHLSAYLNAIGMPTEPATAEFLRLFADESGADPAGQKIADELPAPAQSLITSSPSESGPRMADRAWIVFFDLAAVCVIAAIVAGVTRMTLAAAIAIVGAMYSAAGTLCFTGSVGCFIQERLRPAAPVPPASHPASLPHREVRVIAHRPERPSSTQRAFDEEGDLQDRRASA